MTVPVSTASLVSLIPGGGVLGPEWSDDGDQVTSLDLTNPPHECTAFTSVFDSRKATIIHEFSYLETPDGQYERGHMNLVGLRAASASAVSSTLAAVANPMFAPCAEASAIRRFGESEDGTIDSVSARLVYLAVGGPNVMWRVTLATRSPSGASGTMEMDVGYLGARDELVKIRVATCGCNPPVMAGELLPGELRALQSIALQLARG